jgi:uncharacterized protein YjbJ (UPF0337 family)
MTDHDNSGTENRVKGMAKELEGKVRGAVGDATDNHSEQVKGKAQEVEGTVRQKVGEVQQDAERADRDRRL